MLLLSVVINCMMSFPNFEEHFCNIFLRKCDSLKIAYLVFTFPKNTYWNAVEIKDQSSNYLHQFQALVKKSRFRWAYSKTYGIVLQSCYNNFRSIRCEFSWISSYRDGASLCGVFCAVFNCIQQINMDDSVDVFTTVRQLQIRRPEFCSTQVRRYGNNKRNR